jgi:hypothetical protein
MPSAVHEPPRWHPPRLPTTTALDTVRTRLGPAGNIVVFQVADVLDLHPNRRYTLWHDRAVYHFLTERADYLASLERSLRPAGRVIVATFGPDGPTTCSGLPIVRYSHHDLAAEFPNYELIATSAQWLAVAAGYLAQYATHIDLTYIAAQRIGYGGALAVVLLGWLIRQRQARQNQHSAAATPTRPE